MLLSQGIYQHLEIQQENGEEKAQANSQAVEKTVGWKRLFNTRREDHGEYSKITGIIETPNVASLVSYGLAS